MPAGNARIRGTSAELSALKRGGAARRQIEAFEAEQRQRLAAASQHRVPIHELREQRERDHAAAAAALAKGDTTGALDLALRCVAQGTVIYGGDREHYDLLPDYILLVQITSKARAPPRPPPAPPPPLASGPPVPRHTVRSRLRFLICAPA